MSQELGPENVGRPSECNERLGADSIFDDSASQTGESSGGDESALGDSICGLIGQTQQGCVESRDEILRQLKTYMEIIVTSRMNPNFQAKFGQSDIVQHSMAVAIEKFDQFQGRTKGELLNWVKTILENEIRQQQRALTTQKRDVFREQGLDVQTQSGTNLQMGVADKNWTPRTNAIQQEQAAAIKSALLRLPEDYQSVIQMRNHEQLPFAEIGKRLNKSENAVTKLWYRALVQLRRELEELDG